MWSKSDFSLTHYVYRTHDTLTHHVYRKLFLNIQINCEAIKQIVSLVVQKKSFLVLKADLGSISILQKARDTRQLIEWHIVLDQLTVFFFAKIAQVDKWRIR